MFIQLCSLESGITVVHSMGWRSVWFVFLGRESGPVTSDIHETNKVSVVTSFKFGTIFLDFISNCNENWR